MGSGLSESCIHIFSDKFVDGRRHSGTVDEPGQNRVY